MNIVSREITAQDGSNKLKIIGLKIGSMAIKKKAMYSKRPGLLSTLLSFRDKEFDVWLPVWVWVIVHPEGTFLIDTGLAAEVMEKGYFKKIDFISRYYFETQTKFDIKREEALDHMLQKAGIPINSISKISLTHRPHWRAKAPPPNAHFGERKGMENKRWCFPSIIPTQYCYSTRKIRKQLCVF